MIKEKNIMENTCKIATIAISLHRVFHSIRFKVNKVGVQRYSFFLPIPQICGCAKHWKSSVRDRKNT